MNKQQYEFKKILSNSPTGPKVTVKELKRLKSGTVLIYRNHLKHEFYIRFKGYNQGHPLPVQYWIGDPNGKGWAKDTRVSAIKEAFWPRESIPEEYMHTKAEQKE